MNQHIALLFFLLLSLPCASYAVLNELVRKVPSMIGTHRLMARSMATLSAGQRVLYEQRLNQLQKKLETPLVFSEAWVRYQVHKSDLEREMFYIRMKLQKMRRKQRISPLW